MVTKNNLCLVTLILNFGLERRAEVEEKGAELQETHDAAVDKVRDKEEDKDCVD